MTSNKLLKSIQSMLLMAVLVLSAAFVTAMPVNAEDAIDWSQWEYQSTEYMTQVVAEKHSTWGSGGLANWPTFDCNTADPVFGILRKDNSFEVLTEGVDYTIESMYRTVNHQSTEITTFDKSLPGDYGFKLKGIGKYTGTASVKFTLVDNNPNNLEKLYPSAVTDSQLRIKKGAAVKVVSGDGTVLVKGTDYKVTALDRDGTQLSNLSDFSKAGLYCMTIEGMGAYSGTASVTFKIYNPVGKVSLSATKYTYSGTTKTPTVTVKDAAGNVMAAANYTVKNLSSKTVGKHVVTITFKNDLQFNDAKTVSYTIVPKKTSISTLSKLSKGFKVTWKKSTSANATGYQIKYSTKSSMASAKTVKVTKYSTTYKKITKLKARKKYYVQMRTYKTVSGKTYYSAWSTKKAVTTK